MTMRNFAFLCFTPDECTDVFMHVCRFAFLWLIAAEFSNPFMNAKLMMSAVGYRGRWYVVNGIAFTAAFGIARVGIYGNGLRHFARTACVSALHQPLSRDLLHLLSPSAQRERDIYSICSREIYSSNNLLQNTQDVSTF